MRLENIISKNGFHILLSPCSAEDKALLWNAKHTYSNRSNPMFFPSYCSLHVVRRLCLQNSSEKPLNTVFKKHYRVKYSEQRSTQSDLNFPPHCFIPQSVVLNLYRRKHCAKKLQGYLYLTT